MLMFGLQDSRKTIHKGKKVRKLIMKFKKWMAALLAGTLCMGMMAGCGFTPINAEEAAEETTAFAGELELILSQKDEYLSYLDQAAKASAEAHGCTLSSLDCGGDMDKQLEYVKAAAESEAGAILVVLADDTRAGEVIEAAGDKPVVFVNRIPQDESVLDETHVYVGSDEDMSGTYQGEALAAYFEKQGKENVNYLLFKGTEGLIHTTKRSEGAIRALEAAGISANAAEEPVDCGYDRAKAMEQMTVMLANGLDMSEIDCIIANNDAMALGVIEALKQNNVDMSSIAIVSVDGTNAGLQAIRDGEMLATVHQDAVGQASGAVQAAINLAGSADLMEGISYEQDEDNSFVIWVPFEPVTADNVDDFN